MATNRAPKPAKPVDDIDPLTDPRPTHGYNPGPRIDKAGRRWCRCCDTPLDDYGARRAHCDECKKERHRQAAANSRAHRPDGTVLLGKRALDEMLTAAEAAGWHLDRADTMLPLGTFKRPDLDGLIESLRGLLGALGPIRR